MIYWAFCFGLFVWTGLLVELWMRRVGCWGWGSWTTLPWQPTRTFFTGVQSESAWRWLLMFVGQWVQVVWKSYTVHDVISDAAWLTFKLKNNTVSLELDHKSCTKDCAGNIRTMGQPCSSNEETGFISSPVSTTAFDTSDYKTTTRWHSLARKRASYEQDITQRH